MPRDIPDCPEKRPDGGQTGKQQDYPIKLITPLFGGGVEAGVNDPTQPIRTTAIRGQLQFWWRATRGAAFDSVEGMRRRHAEVWGATDRASPVSVVVANVEADAPTPCARYEGNAPRVTWDTLFAKGALPYALFPFQGKNTGPANERKTPALFIQKASFSLCLRYPVALEADVEAAVWAWVNFGGLGARTRRGCGALHCESLAPASQADLPTWLNGCGSDVSRPWPTLSGHLFCGRMKDPIAAWKEVVGCLKEFRQEPGIGRNPGGARPGRSRFPEPDTIRRITDQWAAGHEPGDMPDGFPRAEFGLPIIFELRGEGEPPKTVLQPFLGEKAGDRMASPLILKPLALKGGKSALPIAVLLNGPRPDRVELQDGQGNCLTPRRAVPVRSNEFASIGNSPLRWSPSGSALEAFLAFIQQAPRSFVEVAR